MIMWNGCMFNDINSRGKLEVLLSTLLKFHFTPKMLEVVLQIAVNNQELKKENLKSVIL